MTAPPGQSAARILVVDDEENYRLLMERFLQRIGHKVVVAKNGLEALEILAQGTRFDLVLLDLHMPGLDGFGVLDSVREDATLRNLPVVIISGVQDISSIARAIEAGAVDHFPKPFDKTLLEVRVNSCLAAKRARDKELELLEALQVQRHRTDALLDNIFPATVADSLKQGHKVEAEHHDQATVVFADLVGFTRLTSRLSPGELVARLDELFTAFDVLADRHDLTKIKTVGDCYMAACGVPAKREDHMEATARFALGMLQTVQDLNLDHPQPLALRIGLHAGSVVSGILGKRRFLFDLWGPTVNFASRLESHGEPGKIHVSREVRDRLEGGFCLVPRGEVELKGLGPQETFWLESEVSK